MQAVEPRITPTSIDVLSPEQSVASRTSFGGTAPERVREPCASGAGALTLPRSDG